VLVLLLGAFSSVHADDANKSPDVRFIYLAKWVNYLQQSPNNIVLLDYGYGAQIFAVEDGRVKKAVLSGPLPGGIERVLEDDGDKYPGQNLRFTSKSIPSLQALSGVFPDGRYSLTLQTQTGNYKDHILKLSGSEAGLAKAADLKLMQCGQGAAPANLNHGEDLVINWSLFDIAANDPGDIMDDLIVVKLLDSKGSVLKRSPLPFFSKVPAIRHDALSHVLSADLFAAETAYAIEVEHINVVDSHIRAGMPEVAAYVTNTKLLIHTNTKPGESSCEKSVSTM
jgi:hypothetical protein